MHLHLKAAFGGAERLDPTTKRRNSLSKNKFSLLAHRPLPVCTPKAAGCRSPGTAGSPNPPSWKG